jgi:hypothetical protein
LPIFRIFLDINHCGQDIGADLATTKWGLGKLSFLITLWLAALARFCHGGTL